MDFAHAAMPDGGNDLIDVEARSSRQRHKWRENVRAMIALRL